MQLGRQGEDFSGHHLQDPWTVILLLLLEPGELQDRPLNEEESEELTSSPQFHSEQGNYNNNQKNKNKNMFSSDKKEESGEEKKRDC